MEMKDAEACATCFELHNLIESSDWIFFDFFLRDQDETHSVRQIRSRKKSIGPAAANLSGANAEGMKHPGRPKLC